MSMKSIPGCCNRLKEMERDEKDSIKMTNVWQEYVNDSTVIKQFTNTFWYDKCDNQIYCQQKNWPTFYIYLVITSLCLINGVEQQSNLNV